MVRLNRRNDAVAYQYPLQIISATTSVSRPSSGRIVSDSSIAQTFCGLLTSVFLAAMNYTGKLRIATGIAFLNAFTETVDNAAFTKTRKDKPSLQYSHTDGGVA